jgi:hypothetical protein
MDQTKLIQKEILELIYTGRRKMQEPRGESLFAIKLNQSLGMFIVFDFILCQW